MVPESVNVDDVPNKPTDNGDKLAQVAGPESPFVDEVSFTPKEGVTPSGRKPQVLTPEDQPDSTTFTPGPEDDVVYFVRKQPEPGAATPVSPATGPGQPKSIVDEADDTIVLTTDDGNIEIFRVDNPEDGVNYVFPNGDDFQAYTPEEVNPNEPFSVRAPGPLYVIVPDDLTPVVKECEKPTTPGPSGTTSSAPSGTTSSAPSGTTSPAPSTTEIRTRETTPSTPETTPFTFETTSSAPSGTTSSAPSGTTSSAPSGTTSSAPSGTTSSAPSGTTSSAPSGTTSSAPSGTTSSAPSGTTSAYTCPYGSMVPETVNVNEVPNVSTNNGDKLVEIADNDSPFVAEVSFTPKPNTPSSGRNPVVLEPKEKPDSNKYTPDQDDDVIYFVRKQPQPGAATPVSPATGPGQPKNIVDEAAEKIVLTTDDETLEFFKVTNPLVGVEYVFPNGDDFDIFSPETVLPDEVLPVKRQGAVYAIVPDDVSPVVKECEKPETTTSAPSGTTTPVTGTTSPSAPAVTTPCVLVEESVSLAEGIQSANALESDPRLYMISENEEYVGEVKSDAGNPDDSVFVMTEIESQTHIFTSEDTSTKVFIFDLAPGDNGDDILPLKNIVAKVGSVEYDFTVSNPSGGKRYIVVNTQADKAYGSLSDIKFDVFSLEEAESGSGVWVGNDDILYIIASPSAVITKEVCQEVTTTSPSAATTKFPPQCRNLVDLTDEEMDAILVGDIRSEPESEDFTYAVSGTEEIVINVPLPIGGELEIINITGSYNVYTVEVLDGDYNKLEDLKNTNGDDVFPSSSPQNKFGKKLDEDVNLVIRIKGPAAGFTAEVTELRICIKPYDFCRARLTTVYQELGFVPLDNVLGVKKSDNTTIVKFGESAPPLESGVVVLGACYECTCEGFRLTCTVIDNCDECPGHSITCVGDCSYAEEVVTYDAAGVPPSCKVNTTSCTMDFCTTPNECPSPWTSWSTCDSNCQHHRTRSCDNCGSSCSNSYDLAQTEECGQCITTTPAPTTTTEVTCEENEEVGCVNQYEQCMETCSVYRQSSVCSNLDNGTDSCLDKCKCKPGYKRNSQNKCVQDFECECYVPSMSTAFPLSYKVNVSMCEYCECTMTGYECKEREDCCELGEWSEWSSCSVTCGTGQRRRERTVKGDGCGDEPAFETQDCEIGECPCMVNGEVYESGWEKVDECQICTCKNGYYNCTSRENPPDPWNSDNCEEKCYCNSEGIKECTPTDDLKKCKEVIDTCNNETHVLQYSDDRCCPECVPKFNPCKKTFVENRNLTVITENGLCWSDDLPLHKCAGSCGESSSSAKRQDYDKQLNKFSLIMIDDCKCCKATVETHEAEFQCENSSKIKVQVDTIASCNCEACS